MVVGVDSIDRDGLCHEFATNHLVGEFKARRFGIQLLQMRSHFIVKFFDVFLVTPRRSLGRTVQFDKSKAGLCERQVSATRIENVDGG